MNEYTIGSGNRASLSTGAPLGEYAKVGSFTADLVFFGGGGGSLGGTWRRVCLSGTSKYIKRALSEWDISLSLSHGSYVRGTERDSSFTGNSEG